MRVENMPEGERCGRTTEQVPSRKCRQPGVRIFTDERINAGIDAYTAALEANNKAFTLHMYEAVNHAFNNDTSAARHDKPAAELAWSRTAAFV